MLALGWIDIGQPWAPVGAQIYLNPSQATMSPARVTIDFGNGIRCSSDGGSIPSLSFSAGAYPDQWGVSRNSSANGLVNGTSSMMGLVTLHVPLQARKPGVDCETMLQESLLKARIENLRQLLEEEVISETQFRQALAKMAGALPKDESPTITAGPPTLEIIATPRPAAPTPPPPPPAVMIPASIPAAQPIPGRRRPL